MPAEADDIPLRAGLAEGDRLSAEALAALPYLIAARAAPMLTSDAVVARVAGLLDDLAERLARTVEDRPAPTNVARLAEQLRHNGQLLAHCHALAIEWLLASRLEQDLALDPVASPLLSEIVAGRDAPLAELAMAALAAQSRFAQVQRRMELPLEELPAELLHEALALATAPLAALKAEGARARQKSLRAGYDEAGTRLAILARLAASRDGDDASGLKIEDAGVSLWLSVVAARSRQERETVVRATAAPGLERLLLTLRACGLSAIEAQRQVLQIQPGAELPRGLDDTGTREAAQWLAGAAQ